MREFKRQRNEFLDVVKYFLIFLVIWGHVVQQSCFLDNPNVDYVYRTIYTVHMPLFMGICGYFFANSIKKEGSIKRYVSHKLGNRIKSLLLPMCFFGLLKSLLLWDFSILSYFRNVHDIWFLGDLLINSLLVLAALHWKQCRKSWLGFLIAGVLSCLPVIGYAGQGLFMYIFFTTGFFISYSKISLPERKSKLVIIATIIYMVAFFSFDHMPYAPDSFTINYHKHSIFELIHIDILKLILGFSGSVVILITGRALFPYIEKTWLVRRAVTEGRYTLDIYLLNIIILEMIASSIYRGMVNYYGMNPLHSYGVMDEIILTFISAVFMMELIILCSRILNGNKVLAKIFFYRK